MLKKSMFSYNSILNDSSLKKKRNIFLSENIFYEILTFIEIIAIKNYP